MLTAYKCRQHSTNLAKNCVGAALKGLDLGVGLFDTGATYFTISLKWTGIVRHSIRKMGQDATKPGSTWHAWSRKDAAHPAMATQREHGIAWDTLCNDGELKLAVGAVFARSPLAQQQTHCRILPEPPQSIAQWRDTLRASPQPDLVLIERAVWDDPEFVSTGLPQLCDHLRYQGHMLWTNPPTRWPQSAQTRASILRLCSLHGLMLLGDVRLEASAPDQPRLRGTLLWRRCPIQTMEQGS